MIDKKLIHFDHDADFEQHESEISESSIVFVKDACRIGAQNSSWS